MVENTNDIFSQEEETVLRIMRTIDKNILQEYAIMVTASLFEEKSNTPEDIRKILDLAENMDKKLRRAGHKK